MPDTWTDSRLDDLHGKVDKISHSMEAGFQRVEARNETRYDSLHADFVALQSTMLQIGGGILVALIGVIGLLATQL